MTDGDVIPDADPTAILAAIAVGKPPKGLPLPRAGWTPHNKPKARPETGQADREADMSPCSQGVCSDVIWAGYGVPATSAPVFWRLTPSPLVPCAE
jgi:hypothetical protein